MPIGGIGTDLVEKARIAKLEERYGSRFVDRILTPEEKQVLPQTSRVDFLAKRFAAKEAVAKALGTGIGKYIAFNEISITNLSSGQPQVTLLGKAAKLAEKKQVHAIHISLSDEKHYALAFAIVE